MSNLLLDPTVGFWTVLGIWAAGTLVFGIAIWVATLFTDAKISIGALAVVVIVSSLASLVPYVGQVLCFGVAVYLLYRMSDTEWGHAALTVILARALVLLLLLAAHSYMGRQREQEQARQEKAQQ